MPWGRMDDKFHRNPKVRALRRLKGGKEALGVWVYWWSWCLDDPDLTGFVPIEELPSADAKAAKLLCDVGLWDPDGDGYRFHDFSKYNPCREDVEAKKLADRERVAAKRAADKASSRENVARDNAATSERVASTRVPSHPIPEEEEGHSPPRRPLEISDEERAEAEAIASNPARQVTAHCAWRAWNLASQAVGAFEFSRHTYTPQWQDIANACNRKARPKLALDMLCAWLWTAPDGPVHRAHKPVEPSRMTPKRMADDLNADLDRAYAWWSLSQEAAE